RRSGRSARLALHSSLRTLQGEPRLNEKSAEPINSSIRNRVRLAVAAALDRKAFNLDVLAVGELTSIADYFILTSATSERQAQAIADSVLEKLREELHVKPLLVEGTTPGR